VRLLAALLALLLPLAPVGAEPSRPAANRLYLPVTVNGQRTLALLDSAAEMTILDDDFAARLGLTPTGSAVAHGSGAATMEARFADHVRIEMNGVALDLRVAVLDLDEMSGRLLGRPIDMLLGRELFDATRLWIDIATRWIERAGPDEPNGVRLAVGEHRGTPTITVAIEGHEPVQAVFDLGNGNEVLIGRAYADRLGLTAPARIVGRRSGGGLGGARDFDIVLLRTLTLAGQEFHDVRAAIDPGETASDLNIGTSLLRNFTITTDFPNHAIWLRRRLEQPDSGALSDRPPIRIQLIDGRLFVPVTVGGRHTLALLDAIATEDVIDDDFARRLGVKDPASSNPETERNPGTIEEQMMRGLDTHVGVDVGLFGFGHTMPHRELGTLGPSDPRPLDLALGRSMFTVPDFRIDMAAGTLGFSPGWPAHGVRLPITEINGRPTFAVGLGGGATTPAMLDTAHGPVRIARALAERRGLVVQAGRVRLPEISLGGRAFTDVEAEVDPAEDAPDLTIGTSILRRFIITTAFVDGEIWLEPVE
jgi:predicted aspartyl protease